VVRIFLFYQKMGIKGLWELVNKKYTHLNKQVPQSSFRGLRIAFDANSWFFVLRSALRSGEIRRTNVLDEGVDEQKVDRLWINEITRRLIKLIGLGITPILVYDGPSPVQKTGTKLKRTSAKDKTLAEIEELNEEIRQADIMHAGSSADILRLNKEYLARMQGLMCKLNYIPADSMNLARTFFQGAGIPTLLADGDGERLASTLCREGIAAAVYSADGDCLAHGAPLIIRDIGADIYDQNGYGQSTFEVVFLRELLEAIDLNDSQFVDLCIMSGCDYNVNMPNIGIGKSIPLIKKFGNIDGLPLDKYDIACLDHHEGRQLFARVPSAGLILDGTKLEMHVPEDNIWEHFMQYGMDGYVENYKKMISTLPPPRIFQHQVKVSDFGFDGFAMEEITGDVLAGVKILEVRNVTARKTRGAARGRGRRGRAVTRDVGPSQSDATLDAILPIFEEMTFDIAFG